jgi:hypothetical protein
LRIIISELLDCCSHAFPVQDICMRQGLSGRSGKKRLPVTLISFTKGLWKILSLYFKGADCFINPVTLGGGIKIKLLEALSHNHPASPPRKRRAGHSPTLPRGKLVMVEDYNWPAFAKLWH